jgi:hypothetical protein
VNVSGKPPCFLTPRPGQNQRLTRSSVQPIWTTRSPGNSRPLPPQRSPAAARPKDQVRLDEGAVSISQADSSRPYRSSRATGLGEWSPSGGFSSGRLAIYDPERPVNGFNLSGGFSGDCSASSRVRANLSLASISQADSGPRRALVTTIYNGFTSQADPQVTAQPGQEIG